MLPSLLRPQFTPVQGVHPQTNFQLYPQTEWIDSDEMISSLWELNLTPPDYGATRRYQVIIVNRPVEGNAAKAQFMYDMGLASLYPADSIQIPGLWVLSVGEAQDAANDFRLVNMQRELGIEPTDVVGIWRNQQEQRALDMKRVSQFGPHHITQRSH
jgi:hypothetical protein